MKMQIVILFAGCLVFHVLAEDSSGLEPDISEETSIKNNNLEEVNTKKEKFSYLLSLLKSAITAEENNTNIKINIIETNEEKENVLEHEIDNPKEDFEVLEIKPDNDTAIFGKTFDKIISKISTAIEKPKNTTQTVEMPTMIPIFKPKPKIESKKCYENPKFKPRQTTKNSKSFDQDDLNLKNKPTQFNIPCQRAVDVLEMRPPEKRTKTQLNSNCIASKTNSNIQNHEPKPVTISVKSKDLDESVRMEFKPKAISLMQLYGNLLRKLTITVLVPYHIKILKSKT